MDAEGDCAHCWSDGVDCVAGTRQSRRRKQACTVTRDRCHRTPTIGTYSVGGCGRRRGVGVVGSDANDGSVGELRPLPGLHTQSSRNLPGKTLASSGRG